LPHLQRLYAALKKQGLALVAVNRGDSEQTVRRYAHQNGFTFKIAMGGKGEKYIGDQYKVEMYPANYLLDADGKVVWRSSSFNEAEIRAVLQRLGVQ
jgi:hypothetical protein